MNFKQFVCSPPGRAMEGPCAMASESRSAAKRKLLLIMKLSAILLLTCCMQISLAATGQKVTIKKKNAELVDVFAEIRKQTGYDFLYSDRMMESAKPVDLDLNNADLELVLAICFKDQLLTYTIENNIVTVKVKRSSVVDKMIARFQQLDVKGNIVDKDGVVLPGATISVKGKRQSTTSDGNGAFELKGVEEGAILVISYVGYKTREVVAKENMGVIRLEVAISELGEVMINKGYYSQSRITNVGSVSTLTAKDIEKQPVSNVLEAMLGRLNGLEIFPKTGVVGAAPAMMVRGQSGFGTIAGGNSANPPLVILDGVPLPPNVLISNGSAWKGAASNLSNLLGLNPADVESISVLKDGDATAIYGSRGSNGVILITTKRGASSKVKTNLSASTGFQKVPHFIDMLSNTEYRAMRREALANSGTAITTTNAPDLLLWDSTRVHDWQKELIGGTATMNDVNLSVSGGNGYTNFYVSAGYHDQGSVMPGDSRFRRASFNASLNYRSPNNRLSMDVQSAYGISDLNLLANDVSTAVFNAPNYPVFTATGDLDWSGNSTNPYASTRQKYATPSRNYSGSIQVGYEVWKGLRLKARAGYNAINTRMQWQQPFNSLNPANATGATLTLQNFDNGNWIVEPFAEYNRDFGVHHLSVISGATFNRQYQRILQISGTGFPNDRMVGDISAASTINRPSASDSRYAYAAFYTRVGYDFDQKYLINLTFRRDGSTKFGPNNKFGNFGAVGVGWVFSRESWAEQALPFLSMGKLRASYGTSGNDNIPDFYYIPTYTTGAAYNGTALLPSNIDNPNLKWEVAQKYEAALELGFLNNRISMTTAYFHNRVKDGLLYYLIAPLVPFNYFISNYPSVVRNAGIEVELATTNLKGAFTWETRLNLSRTRGKMVEFPNLAKSSYSTTYVLGESMTLIKTAHSTGLNSKGEPAIPSTLPADRVVTGDRDPFFGSMTNDFSYKNFSFSFLVQFNRQRGPLNYWPNVSPGTLNYNTTTYALDRWRKPGDEANTNIPRYGSNLLNYNTYISSDMNTKTEYIFRLGNASLSYDLPSKLMKRLTIERLRAFCNAQNLYVFDKYSKWRFDPATGMSGLPLLRTIVFGVNVSF